MCNTIKKNAFVLAFSFLFVFLPGFAAIEPALSGEDKGKDFRNNPGYNEEIDLNHIDYGRINRLIFELTNEIRARYKLKTLTYSKELERTAEMHARDMVKGTFFSHINEKDKTKRTPNDRAKLCNIANPFLAENLIEGFGLQYNSNEHVYLRGKGRFSKTKEGELIKPHTYLSFCEIQMDRWMNSKDHRKNILSKDALEFGCGAAEFDNPEFNEMPTLYVVQNFQCFEPVKKINQ